MRRLLGDHLGLEQVHERPLRAKRLLDRCVLLDGRELAPDGALLNRLDVLLAKRRSREAVTLTGRCDTLINCCVE